MASRVIKAVEILSGTLVIILFVFVVEKYTSFSMLESEARRTFKSIASYLTSDNVICSPDEIKIVLIDGEVCRLQVSESLFTTIFDSYLKHPKGREVLYPFLDDGDITIADRYLNDEIVIGRYDSIKISEITWEEDPYDEQYWRFSFYSLREIRHLLYAYRVTKDIRYRDKLISIIDSFLENGIDKESAWDDYHAVAFRTMVLVNTWWKLREYDALPIILSEKILIALKRHGEFLVDKNHYEETYNHGINQAAALLVLSAAFPDISNLGWLNLSIERLNESTANLIDQDGVLVENSPYYHLYVLEKYWSINQYLKENTELDNTEIDSAIQRMVAYAVHMLQPNLEVPLLGASLQRKVGNSGIIEEIGKKYPEFLYVITQGRKGSMPDSLNKHYRSTGQVIVRSGWGKKTKFNNSFQNQTQVIFDAGPYRTDHSDLDALSFNLYSNGRTLITDTGLYSYEDENPLKNYFHGTRGHNTVMVDGKNQRTGAPSQGTLKVDGKKVTFSAQHDLYANTIHQRSITLIDHDVVLIVDNLLSTTVHDYEQIFHLFPGASTKIDNHSIFVSAKDGSTDSQLKILQIISDDLDVSVTENEGEGCSYEYEKIVPCPMVAYKKRSQDATFVTVIGIGENSEYLTAKIVDKETYQISINEKTYRVHVEQSDSSFFNQQEISQVLVAKYNLDLLSVNGKWQLSGNESDQFNIVNVAGKVGITPKNKLSSSGVPPSFEVEIDGIGSYYSINQDIVLDIPFEQQDSFKIYEQEDYLPILGYHQIIPDDQEIRYPALEMHVSDFDKQIDYLTNTLGCRWFTFGDVMTNYVLKNKKIPSRACVMNFDDGRKNQFLNGYENFKKYGAVATFYIIVNRSIGKESTQYMGVSDLDELYRNGNEIGSHTVDASGLIGDGYDESGLVYQLEESKKILEEYGFDVTTFAYPRGEQNQKIVDIAKRFYSAGRDTSKDNLWRERRSLTASFDEDYTWHMHYHKPELESSEDLKDAIWYNNWWQFEEGYRIDGSSTTSIRPLSAYGPTESSYAVIDLSNKGGKISNKFIVSRDGNYILEVFGTVNTEDEVSYSERPTINVYVDGIKQPVKRSAGFSNDCKTYNKQYYCFYEVITQLNEGPHTLSVEAAQSKVKIDKFRIYRNHHLEDQYSLHLKLSSKEVPTQYPDHLVVSVRERSLVSRVKDYLMQ